MKAGNAGKGDGFIHMRFQVEESTAKKAEFES